MAIKVIHIRDVPTEPEEINTVNYYIGRYPRESKYMIPTDLGNPFSVQEYGRGNALKMYEPYLRSKMQHKHNSVYRDVMRILDTAKASDVNLVCFCKLKGHEPCHGDLIKAEIESMLEPEDMEVRNPLVKEQIQNELKYSEFKVIQKHQGLFDDLITDEIKNKVASRVLDDFDEPDVAEEHFYSVLYRLLDLSCRKNTSYIYIDTAIEMLMERTDREESIATLIKLMDIIQELDLFEFVPIPIRINGMTVGHNVKIKLPYTYDDEAQQDFDNTMYRIPMIVKPKRIKFNPDNRCSGYLTFNDSLILAGKHYKGDICWEVLNKLNSTKLVQNADVAKYYKPVLELTKNLTPKQIEQKTENHKVFCKQLDSLVQYFGKRRMYLTHKYDSRGRVYAQGYHYNYQSASIHKAMLELEDKEVISDEVIFFKE